MSRPRWYVTTTIPYVNAARTWASRWNSYANDLGNLVSRVTGLAHRYRDGRVPPASTPAPGAQELAAACRAVAGSVDAALAGYDVRGAAAGLWLVVEEANRYVERVRPWELARAERQGDPAAGDAPDAALGVLLAACRTLAAELAPFLPGAAATVAARCTPLSAGPAPSSPRLPVAGPPFPRIT